MGGGFVVNISPVIQRNMMISGKMGEKIGLKKWNNCLSKL